MDFIGDIEATVPVARRFARALIGDREAADDVVFACLKTALGRRIQRAHDGSVRRCMLRILVNRYRELLRSAPDRPVALAAVGGASVQSFAASGERLTLDEMQEVLGRLPADQRTVLLLEALEGLSVEQSAQILSRPRGTVLSRLERARIAVGQMTGAAERIDEAPAMPEQVPEERLVLFHAGDLHGQEAQDLAERVDGNPRARATLAEWRRQDAAIEALYGPVLREALPKRFRDLLDGPRTRPLRRPITLPRLRAVVVAGACLVFGLGFGWAARSYLFPSDADTTLAAARAYQTYIADASHAVEIPARNDGLLDAWVSKRFGRNIDAPDLSYAGFRLLGGRVLPSAAGAAVLFVYGNKTGMRLALYVVHQAGTSATVPRYFNTDGTQGFWWLGRGLSYALAGRASWDTLHYVSGLAHDQMP